MPFDSMGNFSFSPIGSSGPGSYGFSSGLFDSSISSPGYGPAIGMMFGSIFKGIGAAVQTSSDYAAVAQKSKEYNYQANQEDLNAMMADYDAMETRVNAGKMVSELYGKSTDLVARQSTVMAGSGFKTSSGSYKDIIDTVALRTEIDADIMKNNANKKAWGFEFEARQRRNKATQYREAADSIWGAGDTRAASTLLGGLAETGKDFYDYTSKKYRATY